MHGTTHSMMNKALILAGVSAMGLTQVACSTTGAKRISGTTSSMADIEVLTERGDQQLDALLVSMDALDEAEDLRVAYSDLSDDIDDLEDTSVRLRKQRASMEARAAEHAALWRNESARLSDERAQEISQDRRTAFEDSVSEVGSELDELREEYEPFIAKLNDLEVMLGNDLTREGVRRTQPVRDEIRELAQDLREQGDDTRERLESARSDFAQ